MAWALVILAGLFETGFALSLKASSGFTRPVPSVRFVVCAAGSFTLLATALLSLPLGSATPSGPASVLLHPCGRDGLLGRVDRGSSWSLSWLASSACS